VTAAGGDNTLRDPSFDHTDLRHQFLRATASTPDNWSGSFMTMEDMGEREFASATTTAFGDQLNEYGTELLDQWNRDHPARTSATGER
jgi:hypothetical protein